MSISHLLSVSRPFLSKTANSLTKDKKVSFYLFAFLVHSTKDLIWIVHNMQHFVHLAFYCRLDNSLPEGLKHALLFAKRTKVQRHHLKSDNFWAPVGPHLLDIYPMTFRLLVKSNNLGNVESWYSQEWRFGNLFNMFCGHFTLPSYYLSFSYTRGSL